MAFYQNSPLITHLSPTSSPPNPASLSVLQVAVSTESQEALCSDGGESSEGLANVASLGLPPSSSPFPFSQQQPALHLVPASPKPSRPSSVHTQLRDQDPSSSLPTPQQQNRASADQGVSQMTAGVLTGSDDITAPGDERSSGTEGASEDKADFRESGSSCLRALKRFHSVETQGRSVLLPRPRPYSWLDDPRRHSVEVCAAVESQCGAASTSSGFVSQADSLQIHSQTSAQTSQPSPRRKKKMSPPCISVEAPDGSEPQSGLYPALGGLGSPPPLPNRDTCLRRRALSSDSKDSFDLGVGEGSGLDRDSPNPNPKLLSLPGVSFEKTSSEH